MTIASGSRYEGVDITAIKFADGTVKKFLHDRRIISSKDVGLDSILHEVVGEQEFDSISNQFYFDSTLWWVIADVNDVLFPFDIEVGSEVVVPSINRIRGSQLQ